MSDDQKNDAPQAEEKVEEVKEEVKREEQAAPAGETKAEEASVEADSSDEGEEVEVPEKFKSLVEEVSKMSVLDLAELVKILEKKFGVSAAAPAVAVVAAGAAAGDEAAEEKTSFDVELTEAGGSKIAVIKAIRVLTDIGLKDAKDLVDAAPKVVKEGVNKEEAEEAKKTLEGAGAKVTLK